MLGTKKPPDRTGFLECEGKRITNEMWYYLFDRKDGIGHTGQGEALYVKDIIQWDSRKILGGGERNPMESLWVKSMDINNSIAVPPTL